MARFSYASEILEAFPETRGGVVHAVGLLNGTAPSDLVDAFLAEQGHVVSRLDATSPASMPNIAAWRRTFSAFGVAPTRYRNAAEALLRRLSKQGSLPSINLLVDLANLVSIRHALPVAVFDQRLVTGGTTVRFASGDERFTDLGSGDEAHPEAGEVVFVDDVGLVSARRWCWRQSAGSAAGRDTTEALITVEGQHEGADADVAAAMADLGTLLTRFQPEAMVRSAMLGPARPQFPD